MDKGPALALQVAVIAALRADLSISELVADRIYDEPPEGAKFPYVRLGAIEPFPQRTSSTDGVRLMFGIEAHSRPIAGRVEATRINEAVIALLGGRTQALSLEGHRMVSLEWMTQTTGRETDGKSYLGITAFQALIEPSGS
ncbi:Protein of unknown function [Loktanella atrilutea]|uniref:DUF3168 domain-containing protein n=1 Tax=Loktanella atrilutea TaxID=366533 RepID=A0A1M5DKS4_LOKAT|nr:DUF3168 domain-containing protein [Loktanella atrilutea]SHF67516.1 Protein of unknown function [Loktanella atrilutea]